MENPRQPHGATHLACPECGITLGHKIQCKTGNDRARAYQSTLAAKPRRKRKPMFTIEQALAWADRHNIQGSPGSLRDAMEDAATPNKPNTK